MGRYSERYKEWEKVLVRWEKSGLYGAEFRDNGVTDNGVTRMMD